MLVGCGLGSLVVVDDGSVCERPFLLLQCWYWLHQERRLSFDPPTNSFYAQEQEDSPRHGKLQAMVMVIAIAAVIQLKIKKSSLAHSRESNMYPN